MTPTRPETIALAAALLAGACAPHDDFMRDINAMKGQPANPVAFTAFGHPSDEKIIGGDTVYVWRAEGDYRAPGCTLRVIAGKDGRVKGGDVEGSPRACRVLAR